MYDQQTICALATPFGLGGIAVIRLSGHQAIKIADSIVHLKNKRADFLHSSSHKLYFADFIWRKELVDEGLVSVFRAPHSYTGEDTVEFSCHASPYIQKRMLEVLTEAGARAARAGEFSMRAFLNGKMDLSQAEAVADLLAAENKTSHQLALAQLRGGYSSDIARLRQKLLDFASLIELELDFSEEDVEFADRTQLKALLKELKKEISKLKDSFALGNALKNGIAVAIVGPPNAGKSTLLNALLNEEKAIVSEIAGTTRDLIEDRMYMDGICFRFVDTAGLRHTEDTIEKLGIERSLQAVSQAQAVLYVFDIREQSPEAAAVELNKLIEGKPIRGFLLANKIDCKENVLETKSIEPYPLVPISAKEKISLGKVKELLMGLVQTASIEDKSIVSNIRHYEALVSALQDVERVEAGMEDGISSDLLALDIRSALRHLGSITGDITEEDILGNIFGRFCIGK